MWETGKFPEGWELATIIPIPKPGKIIQNLQIIGQWHLQVVFVKSWRESSMPD